MKLIPSDIRNNKHLRNLFTLICVIASGYLQATVIEVFMRPMNLLASGFTGVAILIEKMTSTFFGLTFSTSLGMLLLNIPVAILCIKTISKRFVFFSMLQVFSASLFLNILDYGPLFDDPLLNIIFGGFSYGIMALIALKGNASTGGTDFVALYISNKTGKSIWTEIFIFNACQVIIFGYLFGFEYAGYSILFQFITTKTIDSFYHRYKRMTLQITTSKADEVIDAYIKNYKHGISRLDGTGGYSKKPMSLLHTVVSSYEVEDVAMFIKEIDPNVIINTFKTENFYGHFYIKPID